MLLITCDFFFSDFIKKRMYEMAWFCYSLRAMCCLIMQVWQELEGMSFIALETVLWLLRDKLLCFKHI